MKQNTDNDCFTIMTRALTILCTSLLALTVSCSPRHKVVEESYPDGSPRRECEYRGSGEKKELMKETFFYANGQIEMTGGYRDGERNGNWIYYYENGNVWSEGSYKNGKNDGKRLTYYENGRLRYEAWYKENERTGLWKFYDQAGNLIKEVDYTQQQ